MAKQAHAMASCSRLPSRTMMEPCRVQLHTSVGRGRACPPFVCCHAGKLHNRHGGLPAETTIRILRDGTISAPDSTALSAKIPFIPRYFLLLLLLLPDVGKLTRCQRSEVQCCGFPVRCSLDPLRVEVSLCFLLCLSCMFCRF